MFLRNLIVKGLQSSGAAAAEILTISQTYEIMWPLPPAYSVDCRLCPVLMWSYWLTIHVKYLNNVRAYCEIICRQNSICKLHVTSVGFERSTLFFVNFLNKAKETVVTNVHMKIRMMDASSFSEAWYSLTSTLPFAFRDIYPKNFDILSFYFLIFINLVYFAFLKSGVWEHSKS